MMEPRGRNSGAPSASGGMPLAPHGWLVLALCDNGHRHNTRPDSEDFRDPPPVQAGAQAARGLAALIGWLLSSAPPSRHAA